MIKNSKIAIVGSCLATMILLTNGYMAITAARTAEMKFTFIVLMLAVGLIYAFIAINEGARVKASARKNILFVSPPGFMKSEYLKQLR